MTKRKIFISLIVGLLLSLIFIVGSSAATNTCAKGHTAGKAATCTTAQKCTKCGTVIKAKLGHKYTTKTTKAATCTAKGTKKHTCSRCSYSYTSSIAAKGHKAGKAATCTAAQKCTTCNAVLKAKLGHKYSSSYTVDKKATCTAAGSKSKHCTRSGCTAKTSVTSIAAKGHTKGKAATCTTAQKCTVCSTVIKAKLGHKYSSSYTVDKKATCTAAGSKSKHCTRSGCTAKTSVTSIAAKGHTKGKAATCTAAQKCTVCSTVIKAKLGHKYSSSYTVDKKATCTAAGSKSKHCTRSGCTAKSSVTSIAKIAHKAGAAATCTTAQKCTVCSTVIKAKLNHSYSSSYTVDKKATCTAAGSKSKHCTRSGCTAKTSVTSIAKIAHKAGAAATCTTAQKCTVCSTVIKAKLGHKYSSSYTVDKKATCTAAGSKSKHCTRSGCTAKSSVTSIAATGHKAGAAATCTTAQTCTTCKAVIKAKLGHSYSSSYTVDKKATCTAAGSKSKHCTRSGCTAKSSVTSIAKIAHKAGAAATCTTAQKCTVCSTVLKSKLGHTYTEATLVDSKYHSATCDVCGVTSSSLAHDLVTEYNAQSCTTDAFDLTYCELCSYSEVKTDENNKATGHKKVFDETVPPTCTAGGYDLYVCGVAGCNAMLPTENHTDKIPHNYTKDNELSSDATCTSFGVKVMACAVCKDSYDEILPATGHKLDEVDDDFQDEIDNNGCITINYICANDNCSEILKTENHVKYKIDKIKPTCTEEGLNTYVCRGCNVTIKTETVAPTGHDVEHTIVLPTCTEDGSYSYASGHCSDCDTDVESTDKIILPATGHSLNMAKATCTTASYCTNKNCTYVKEEALGHDYSIANCEISEKCTGFYCNRCGNLLDTTKEKLDTYNALLNRMISTTYSQAKNLSFIKRDVTDITYTELDFGIYTSLVKDMFDESMQGTETTYSVLNDRLMYGNYRPLNLYASASKLEESDIRSISVLTLSELKASTLFSQLDSQITSTSNKETFDTSAYENKVFRDVIRVTVNVKDEDLKSIRALKQDENPALSKMYAVNVKDDLIEYINGPKIETDASGFLMKIDISSLNTSGNTTYYFDASTYEPIAAVYNISVSMSQHIDMDLSAGPISLNGTMAPKETSSSHSIYLFSGFFTE